jgi:hypothetical protein
VGLLLRETDDRKLDHATLETLRIHAVQPIEAGEHPEDVARALGWPVGRCSYGYPSTAWAWKR